MDITNKITNSNYDSKKGILLSVEHAKRGCNGMKRWGF